MPLTGRLKPACSRSSVFGNAWERVESFDRGTHCGGSLVPRSAFTRITFAAGRGACRRAPLHPLGASFYLCCWGVAPIAHCPCVGRALSGGAAPRRTPRPRSARGGAVFFMVVGGRCPRRLALRVPLTLTPVCGGCSLEHFFTFLCGCPMEVGVLGPVGVVHLSEFCVTSS